MGIDRYIVIAADGSDGVVLLSTVGPDAGRVIYHRNWTRYSYHADRYAVVAKSLPRFLAEIFASDPVWAQQIVRNDLTGLRAWLDAGGDPNAVHPGNEFTPLSYAISDERLDVIRELLARGARPMSEMRQQGGYRFNPEIARLIEGASLGRS